MTLLIVDLNCCYEVSCETRDADSPLLHRDYRKCKEIRKLFKKKECFDKGNAVTFLPGGYFCCYDSSDSELLAIGELIVINILIANEC